MSEEKKIDTFEVKVQKLIEAFTELKAENEELKNNLSEKERKINELTMEKNELSKQINNFESKTDVASSMIDDILNKINQM